MPEYEECTLLSAQDKKEEYIMLSLRLEKGLSLDRFENLFGKESAKTLLEKVQPYIPNFMVFENGCLKFTSQGFLVSNTILSELI
jgi:oxygen-independent coproporphyrinogen-3 oxidase